MGFLSEVAEWLIGEPARILIAVVIVAVLVIAASPRRAGTRKDPKRSFDAAQRSRIHARAGHQCEHKPLIGRRCRRAGVQADHVYPHARGGATSVANGQSLCAFHNRTKSALVPSRWYIARLERRRRTYFPPGERVEVNWHQPGYRV